MSIRNNKRQITRKLIIITFVLGLIFIPFIMGFCYFQVKKKSKNLVFYTIDKIDEKKVALVLGTSKYTSNGYKNWYFVYRIRAAVKLYKSGKCEYIIVSGDNSIKGYNEPEDMQQELIKLGVPKNRIYLDYAGFRTLDSIVRTNTVFGQTDFIIISQKFHNERAVYIANQKGFNVQAYNAKDVNMRWGWKVHVREVLARVKMMLDIHVINKKPKFGGKKIKIGD